MLSHLQGFIDSHPIPGALAYLIIFGITYLVVAILPTVLLGVARLFEKNQPGWKDGIAASVLLLACPFGAFLALCHFHIYLPRPFEARELSVESFQGQAAFINREGESLIDAFQKPEDLTLFDMRGLVDRARAFAGKATTLSRDQAAVISQLRQTVEDESKRAKEAQRLAENVRAITSDQLQAIKFIITKDADDLSRQYFIYGLIVSFPIGIVAAICCDRNVGTTREEKQCRRSSRGRCEEGHQPLTPRCDEMA